MIGDATYETPVINFSDLFSDQYLGPNFLNDLPPPEEKYVYLTYVRDANEGGIIMRNEKDELLVEMNIAPEPGEILYHVRGSSESAPILFTIQAITHSQEGNMPNFHYGDFGFEVNYRLAVLNATLSREIAVTYFSRNRAPVSAIIAEPSKEIEIKFWELTVKNLVPLIIELEKPFMAREYRKPGFYYRTDYLELSPDLLREREPSAVYEHRKLSFSTYRQISGFPIRSAFNEFIELVDAYYRNEEFISAEGQFEQIAKQLGLYGGGSKFVVLIIDVLRFFYFFYDPIAV